MVSIDRRRFLALSGAALAQSLSFGRTGRAVGAEPVSRRLGIGSSSYSLHNRERRTAGFTEPLRFLRFCRERGAGGVQMPLGELSSDAARELRREAESSGMYVEGSVQTPRDEADTARFEAQLRMAHACGATVVRTVMLGGRRYETFDSAEAYGEFRERSWKSLTLAEPLVRRHGLRLAVENHKDYRTDELLDVLGRLASPHVGVCVDTGNNLALLEPVESTVAQLAPWAVSCHLKDMAVEETSEGFLLSEVPLGQGMLDLAGIVQTLTRANPQLQFSLEMITRDPLVVPCLQEFYWRTLNDVPGGELAGMVRLVRAHPPRRSLPRITGKTVEEQLQFEDRNVIESLQHAREHLGL